MKWTTKIASLALGLHLSSCATLGLEDNSQPEKKEPANPKMTAEINRLLNVKSTGKISSERNFSSDPRPGWVIYRSFNRKTNEVSVIQHQTIQIPGTKKFWLETRVVDSRRATTHKTLINLGGAKDKSTADGKRVAFKVERDIFWMESDAEARESSDSMIEYSNKVSGAVLGVLSEQEMTETRSATTPAGHFAKCYISDEKEIMFLRDEVKACKSSALPSPFVVESDSKSARMEVISFGFDTKPSLIPSNIKIVKQTQQVSM